MEQGQIYREKSVTRIQSPEQLNDYLRVTSPGVWLALAAALVILAGTLVWSGVGWLESGITCEALSNGGEIVAALPDARTVQAGMPFRAGGVETRVESVRADEDGRFYATARAEIPDGVWTAEIITERIHPLKFLFN